MDPTVSLCPPWQSLLFVPSPPGRPAPLRSPGRASPRWQLRDQVPGEVLPDHPVAAWWDEGENGARSIALEHLSSVSHKKAAAGADRSACPGLRHVAAAGKQTERVPGPGEGRQRGLTPHRGSWPPALQHPTDTQRRPPLLRVTHRRAPTALGNMDWRQKPVCWVPWAHLFSLKKN